MKISRLWAKVSSSLVSAALFSAIGIFGSLSPAYCADVVFDECHAQTAGNADWTANGGFSDFANTFKSFGLNVVSAKKGITADILKNASVLVLSEPNSVLTKDEKTAIDEFVKRGGGLFAIADHKGADRNNDGIDALGVLNQILPKMGLQYDTNSINEFPIPVTPSEDPAFLTGVKAIGTWAGTTVTAVSPESKSLIPSKKQAGKFLMGYSAPAGYKGRVVAFGDSSIFDDGTGAPGKKLYDGYNRKECTHIQLTKNCIAYLLNKQAINESVENKAVENNATVSGGDIAKNLDGNVTKHWDPSHPGHVHQNPNGTTYNQPGDNYPGSAGTYPGQTQTYPQHTNYPQQQPNYPQYPQTPTYPQTPSYPPAPQYSDTDVSIYEAGFSYYNQGNYALAAEYFKRVVNGYSSSRYYEGSMYYIALCYKNMRNYNESARWFQQMINKLRTSRTRPDWFLEISLVYDAASNYMEAARWYQNFVREYPAHQRAAECLYASGQEYEKAGYRMDASNAYRRVTAEYAYSPYASMAYQRLQTIGY
ncbi:MAG TPA: tetratricopeptide repeat protein [Candidatus Wallbacteria bacterium]|nr:tetratricopeptide repeat protein [Candidatus Wallbacteria bacterium]